MDILFSFDEGTFFPVVVVFFLAPPCVWECCVFFPLPLVWECCVFFSSPLVGEGNDWTLPHKGGGKRWDTHPQGRREMLGHSPPEGTLRPFFTSWERRRITISCAK